MVVLVQAWQVECCFEDRQATQSCPRVLSPILSIKRISMKPAYDIFRKDLLGTPVWMESVQDMEKAKLRLTELARRSPGEYFVVFQETQEIVCETPTRYFDLAIKGRSLTELLI